MNGLTGVIAKRLQLHVRSVTWLVTVALIAVVFGAAARRSTTLFDIDAAAFEADRAAHSAEADRFYHVYSELSVAVDRPPAPLRLLARGVADALPSCATIHGRFGPTALRARQNTLVPGPLSFDPAHVVGLFGSLLALLVTCDVFAKEREQGTLQLVLTYPARRSTVFFGEYLAAVILVLVPTATAVLLFVAISGAAGRLSVDGDVLSGLAIFLASLALLISAAAVAGLTIATFVRNSAVALTIGLFAWVIFGVLHPAIAPSFARLAEPVDPLAAAASSDTLAKYWHKPRPGGDDREAERVLQQRIAQAAVYHRLAFLSPYTLYVGSAEAVAGTGANSYGDFLTAIDRIAAQFTRWEDEKLAVEPARATTYSITDPPLDIGGLPGGEITAASPQRADAVPGLLVLVLWNLLFFGIAHVRFAHYDPRP